MTTSPRSTRPLALRLFGLRGARSPLASGALFLAFLSLGSLACGGGGVETAAAPSGVALPDSAFKVEWGQAQVPAEMAAGSVVPIAITFKNGSDQTWLDPQSADPSGSGAYAVRVAWRWQTSDEQPPGEGTSTRGDLAGPLGPGQSATVRFEVTAPAAPGQYTLQVDLVQELVAWFEGRGAPRLLVPVSVR